MDIYSVTTEPPNIDLTKELFEPLVGSEFKIEVAESKTAPAILTEVNTFTGETLAENRQQPFSLIFTVQSDGVLEQMAYNVSHKDTGSNFIFLVPLGPNDNGAIEYEAVFN